MTNEEILQKAIEKAEKNGYKKGFRLKHNWDEIYRYLLDFEDSIRIIIFSHDFAKAFWGDSKRYFYMNVHNRMLLDVKDARLRGIDHCPSDYEWEYNLKSMVLSKAPLKYLEKFL